jgi:hypothetical protein
MLWNVIWEVLKKQRRQMKCQRGWSESDPCSWDWMTDDLSNFSKTEMVCTSSSKECGSALMMAITASSSQRLSRVKEDGESD